jgi:Neuraminidase (sialidase)
VYVIRSTDGGETWEQIEIDRVAAPPICQAKGCPKAHYGSQGSIASDEDGDLALIYNGGDVKHGGEQIWARTSNDGGATWSERRAISPGGEVIAAFPALAGTGDGDFRAVWADDRNGSQKRWNMWYSRSSDGGKTWSQSTDISDGTDEKYQHAEGFPFFYGDYGDIGITQDGETITVWAESASYNGPGTTWYNIGR